DVIRDRLATARRWAQAAHDDDPAARYYFLLWNCLWRAGGSIVHGHMQMTATRSMHYPKIEQLRRQAIAYDERHRRDYFDDLWRVHEALGLGVERGSARVFASLTPVKESEVVILGRAGEDEVTLAPAIALAIGAFRARGVVAYNFALFLPPLSTDGNDWRRFPPQARLVDRGDPAHKTSDIGAMELDAASVVGADPFRVVRKLDLLGAVRYVLPKQTTSYVYMCEVSHLSWWYDSPDKDKVAEVGLFKKTPYPLASDSVELVLEAALRARRTGLR